MSPTTTTTYTGTFTGAGGTKTCTATVTVSAATLAQTAFLSVTPYIEQRSVASYESALGCKSGSMLVEAYNDRSQGWVTDGPAVSVLPVFPGRAIIYSLYNYDTSLGTLVQASTGAYDSEYTLWANQIISGGTPAPDGNYYVRTMWETPGTWFPWGADVTDGTASLTQFISAFRHFANAFHAVSPKFKIVWDIQQQSEPNDWTDASVLYPGDQYVDVMSEDVYPQAGQSFSNFAATANGLNWLAQFASQHNKSLAITEWGPLVNNDPDASFAQFTTDMANWIKAHNVVYQSAFDVPQWLANGSYPQAQAAYKAAYCPN